MNRRTQIYVGVLALAFLAALAAVAWVDTGRIGGFGWLPLLGLAVASEALVLGGGEDSSSLLSFSAAAHVAAAIVYGPEIAGILAALGVIIVDGPRLSNPRWLVPNAAMFGLAAVAGGVAYQMVGGTVGSVTAASAAGLVAVVVVRYMANTAILCGGIALSSGRPFWVVFLEQLRASGGTGIGEGSLGVLVAACYGADRWVALPFLVPLLGALYMSKFNLGRLERETAAALNTFAQVIDERHQSTASHTKRVADYVDRFVRAIDLPDREAERLRAAARYHDLGKVAVDEATLSKAGRLDEAELRAIRRHPRLSARLLAPFHFASEIAVYTELHHERYDGRGYYRVDQSRIPVEAHVLIVADSFDAMTSTRSYRPALTVAEATAELRDKAGSQFHPQVATAFAAMIEGHDPADVLGPQQVARLRGEFARIPLFTPTVLRHLLDTHVIFTALLSTTIVAFGVPTSWLVRGTLLAATGVGGTAALLRSLRQKRRITLATTAVEDGHSPQQALRAAGLDCWACWLVWDDAQERYDSNETPVGVPPTDVEVACLKAMRIRPPADAALPSGRPLVITSQPIGEPRLAVACTKTPTTDDRRLINHVASTSSPATPNDLGHASVVEASDHTMVIELGLYERVRITAGQLVAERAVAHAMLAVTNALRDADTVVQIGDDRLGVTLADTNRASIDDVQARIGTAIATVRLPGRVWPRPPRFVVADTAGREAA